MTKTHILVLRVRGHTSTATVRAHSHLLLVHETTRRLTPRPVISASVLPSGAARPRRPGLLLPFPVAALHPVALVDAAHLSAREVPARAHRLERVLIRNHPERRRPRVGILLVRGSGALPALHRRRRRRRRGRARALARRRGTIGNPRTRRHVVRVLRRPTEVHIVHARGGAHDPFHGP